MSQEIVFTSARHGLRTGSTGFCTVRSTRGMPGNLAQLLERLTGYTHAFDAYGDQANLNPVNFSHYTARLGDQRFHILSRVSNAPLDHTNRSNKLAQLLAIESSDLEGQRSEGPAAESLKIPWVKEWSSDTTPCVLPDEKQIDLPLADQSKPGICNLWKEATGDAGWAAELASSVGESTTPMQVILPRDVGCRPETWALQLVHEALSLVPPENRWDVTYSTFFGGNLPISINCQWQFILDGTDAAKRARLDPRPKTIDIPTIAERKLPAPPNQLTAMTFSTTRPWDNHPEDSTVARRRSAGSTRPSSPDAAEAVEDDVESNETHSQYAGKKKKSGVSWEVTEPGTRRRSKPLLLRPASLMLMFVVIATLVGILVQQRPRPGESAKLKGIVESSTDASMKAEANRDRKQQRELDAQRKEDEAQRQKQEDDAKQAQLASLRNSPEIVEIPEMVVRDEPEPVADGKPATAALPPLQDVRDQGNCLPLKLPSFDLRSASDGPIRLAKIHVTSVQHFELKRIIGGRSVLKPGLDFSLESNDTKGETFREWNVIRKSTSGVGLGGNPDVVGTFRLDRLSNLSFRWDRKNEGYEIINCLLEMEAGEPSTKPEVERCKLRKAMRVKPIQFDLNLGKQFTPLVSRNQVTDTQRLELKCDFIYLPGQVSRTGTDVLRVGDTVRFRMQEPGSGRYLRVAEISVKLKVNEQDVGIEMEAKMDMPIQDPGADDLEVRSIKLTPGLMGKTDENIEKVEKEIGAERNKLETARKELEILEAKLKQFMNDKGEITNQRFKHEFETQEAFVQNLDRRVTDRSAELAHVRALADDLRKMLGEIEANGRLQFSLRLMIPDAGERGIELMETDNNGLQP